MFCGFSASSSSREENGDALPHPDIHNLPSREDEQWGAQEGDRRDEGQQKSLFFFPRKSHQEDSLQGQTIQGWHLLLQSLFLKIDACFPSQQQMGGTVRLQAAPAVVGNAKPVPGRDAVRLLLAIPLWAAPKRPVPEHRQSQSITAWASTGEQGMQAPGCHESIPQRSVIREEPKGKRGFLFHRPGACARHFHHHEPMRERVHSPKAGGRGEDFAREEKIWQRRNFPPSLLCSFSLRRCHFFKLAEKYSPSPSSKPPAAA